MCDKENALVFRSCSSGKPRSGLYRREAMGPLGDIAKVLSMATELIRAVNVLNSRIEQHTLAMDRVAAQGEVIAAKLTKMETRIASLEAKFVDAATKPLEVKVTT